MTEEKRPNPMKKFLEKFFNLFREYEQETPLFKMTKILRSYAERLDS